MSRQNVILERIEEQQRVVIEAVISNRDEFKRGLAELKTELSSRMDVLEVAVRQNSSDIKQMAADIRKNSTDIQKNSTDIQKNSTDIQKNSTDIQKNSTDIRKNSTDIQSLSDKLDTKADTGRVTQIEHRVGALESAAS